MTLCLFVTTRVNMECINCGKDATHPQLLLCDDCHKIYQHITKLAYVRNKKGIKNNDYRNLREVCINRIKKKYNIKGDINETK